MKFLRVFFFLVLWLAAYASWAQTVTNDGMVYNLHDPTLDSINNNLGYLDADLNGHMNNLPERISRTNFSNATNSYKGDVRDATFAKLNGFPGNPTLNTNATTVNVDGVKGTNAGALKALTGVLFTHFGNSLSNGFPTNVSPDGVNYSTNGANRVTIPNTLGASWFFDLSFDTGGYLNRTYAGVVRNLILAAEYVFIFLLFLETLKEQFGETMNQRQTMGSAESVLGNNASAVVGAAYAIAITAALAGVVVLVFGLSFASTVTTLGSIPSLSSSFLGFLNTAPAWELFSAYVPFWQLFGAWAGYYAMKYLLLTPAFMGVRAIILWLLV